MMFEWESVASGVQRQLSEIILELKGSNERLDRLERGQAELKFELKSELATVNRKIDGIGEYLINSDRIANRHADRIFDLEKRVEDIEKRFDTD